MGKYRMRPVEKEAWPISDIIDTAMKSLPGLDPGVLNALMEGEIKALPDTLDVVTLEGTMTGHRGDYLVRGLQGEFYPVQKAIFEKSYERID